MKLLPLPRALFVMLAVTPLLNLGCASTRRSATPDPQGVVVEGELVQSTGSRISHVVKKGNNGGVANDMPGTVTGTKGLEREQNDMIPQSPISGL